MTARFRSTPLDARAAEHRLRLRRGRVSEALAAAMLIAKGYRILGRRVRTRAGEIDIVAVRGKRLAFVEVKRRLTREDAEAAVSARQAARIRPHPPRVRSVARASPALPWARLRLRRDPTRAGAPAAAYPRRDVATPPVLGRH
jgi:Uncharacterised protein family UPF0102